MYVIGDKVHFFLTRYVHTMNGRLGKSHGGESVVIFVTRKTYINPMADDAAEQRTQRSSRMTTNSMGRKPSILDRLDRPVQGRLATGPSILSRLDTPLTATPLSRPLVEPKKASTAASRTSDARQAKFSQNRGLSVGQFCRLP
jgi:hypothetical protein